MLQKIKRTNYVSVLWKNAHLQDPLSMCNVDATTCGWKLNDGKYEFVWFEGDQMPPNISENIDSIPRSIADVTDSHESDAEYIDVESYESGSDESDYDNEFS